MRAFVLAAGLGTRLRPLTDQRPKALVEISGVPLLEIVLARLEQEGFRHIVVNAHHWAEQVAAFVAARRSRSRARLEVSPEPLLLDTGGGLLAARALLDAGGSGPILVHNVDVLSDIPLGRFWEEHRSSGALASLVVKDRPTARKLRFASADLQLLGKAEGAAADTLDLAFGGIHAVDPSWFELPHPPGAFPIVPDYIAQSHAGQRVRGWRADAWRWKDVGRPEHLSPLEPG